MTSADFSQFIVTAWHVLACEISPVRDVFFPSYTCLIYSKCSEQLLDFVLFSKLIHTHKPLYQVSVRQARCLPKASFKFQLAMDTLALGWTLPVSGRVRDLHPLEYVRAGRTKKIPTDYGWGIPLLLT